MGILCLLCVVAAFSNAELVLQGFLHLPHHRFLFHNCLFSKGRSYPVENGGLVGRFGEIFLTVSRCCFPDFMGFFKFLEGLDGLLKILLHCRWQFRLPSDFFEISV